MAFSKVLPRTSMGLLVAGLLSQPASALTHTGGAFFGDAVNARSYDASDPRLPVVTDQTEAAARTGAFVFAHDALFVASNAKVSRFDRRDLKQPIGSSWSAPAPVLALADGPERGLVLVLDTRGLSLVRFSDADAPVALWSTSIDSSSLATDPGRLVVRDGSRAYVADASLPGLRVLSIDPEQAPTTIATYVSPDGSIHDLSLWGHRLALAADRGLALVNVTAGDEPELQRLGAFPSKQMPARVDANSRYAFLADGSTLSVVDIDPKSPGFLESVVDGWQAPSNIRSVKLDRAGRAYVMVNGAYEILDVAAFGR